ncbi:uncharacterized protein [Venturia canescens]|uniref:uncharacterized protein isoform X2 n=1 Tax=Venturia canescens TaxID=32260 RepID=UPI001C9BD5EC|nr:uncharacterized protein LOC122416509 isoform X2 [Venturia canescens]
MTSLVTGDDRKAPRMKPKSGNKKISIDGTAPTSVKDESRSFLDFSRENLSISQSELEQGFNKPSKCFHPGSSRHGVLSLIAIFVALACAALEIWEFHRVISNSRDIEIIKRDIEIIKRDVESLRDRMFGEDFVDDLKAFEEQLYADGSQAEDSGEADIEGADYDSNYEEDYSPNWNDYVSDLNEPTAATTQSLVARSLSHSLKSEDSKSTSSPNPEGVAMLAVLHKVEARQRQALEQSVHETRDNVARERLVDQNHESPGHKNEKNREHSDDHAKRRRAIADETLIHNTKRTVFSDFRSEHNRSRHENVHTNGSEESRTPKRRKNKILNTETMSWNRHPPKKYFAVTRVDSSEDLADPSQAMRRHSVSWDYAENLGRLQRGSDVMRRSLKQRVITRRHLRTPKQVFAVHYGADSALFGMEDEHTGNGRAKHNEGIFKAWRPSDWVADLGMNKHFTLSHDGRLSVHEPGLYLVYAQIHYLDEHDENGFHVLVNGQPIFQCMVYSPSTGHKSRSCFSAQITVLQASDRLVLKDVSSARYTLFQHDKSFFGLVKLGDSRQQQQPKHTTRTPETLL